jgi:hypothetical protein
MNRRVCPLRLDLGQLLGRGRIFLGADKRQRVPWTARLDKRTGGIFERFLKARMAAVNERAAVPEDLRSQRPDK